MTTMSTVVHQRLAEGTFLLAPWTGGLVLGKRGAPVFVAIDQPDPFQAVIARIETVLGKRLPRLGKVVEAFGFSFSLQMNRHRQKLTVKRLDAGTSHQHLMVLSALGHFGDAPARLL